MLVTSQQQQPQPSFRDFIRKDRINRRWLVRATVATIAQLILFKIFYPYASYFFTDSFAYIYAAASNLDANVWPVGYSKFLRVFNTFLHPDLALVSFQYLFLQFSGFYFLITLLYIFRPGKAATLSGWIFFTFQPVFLYIANSVASDALFIGLSLIWISRLIKMINRPSRCEIVLQALLVTVLFTIRYNAMIYPLVAVLAIILSKYSLRQKWIAIVLPVIGVSTFIGYTKKVTKEMSGVNSFSPFSGWQIANNALYMYGHIKEETPPPARFRKLDSTVRQYLDKEKYPHTLYDSIYPGIYFLWSPHSPLQQYMGQQRSADTSAAYFRSWAAVSPLYADYGSWLIKQYPTDFAQYWLWPNLVRYALPPLEFIDRYNSGMDTVDVIAKYWFHYKDNKVGAFSAKFQHHLLAWYPLLCLLGNGFFLGITALFFTTRGVAGANPLFRNYVLVIAVLWMAHFLFSVVAAPVVLRYQVFLLLLNFSSSLLLVECLLKWDKARTEHTTTPDEKDQHTGGKLRVRLDSLVGVRGG